MANPRLYPDSGFTYDRYKYDNSFPFGRSTNKQKYHGIGQLNVNYSGRNPGTGGDYGPVQTRQNVYIYPLDNPDDVKSVICINKGYPDFYVSGNYFR